jgi:hypothetical protein
MRKILMGCGVVVGLCIVIIVVGALAVRSWLGRTFPDAERSETVQAQLEERFGKPETFVPPLDGVPSSARIERFVIVRESVLAERDAAAGRLTAFVDQVRRNRGERPWITKALEGIRTVREGGEMAAAMAQYVTGRTQALLDAEMGEGEYAYLYGLTHFGWLDVQPFADSMAVAGLGGAAGEIVEEVAAARSRIARVLRTQYANQERALAAKATRTPAEEAALAALRSELPQAEHSDAIPFVGRAPAAWTAPLEPYRARLTATLAQTPLQAAVELVGRRPRDKRSISIE